MKLRAKIGPAWYPPDEKRTDAKSCFPQIEVDQATGLVTVCPAADGYTSPSYPSKARVTNVSGPLISTATDGQALIIRGEVDVKNYCDWKRSGTQAYVFAVFVGDSGHIYTHRAPSSNGWRKCRPSSVLGRLRKLGDARATRLGTVQQGDILLIPVRREDVEVQIGQKTVLAKADALPEESFRHESAGIGHHQFSVPVLYADAHTDGKRRLLVREAITMTHRPSDGATHPAVQLPPGQYIVSGTASSLRGGGLD